MEVLRMEKAKLEGSYETSEHEKIKLRAWAQKLESNHRSGAGLDALVRTEYTSNEAETRRVRMDYADMQAGHELALTTWGASDPKPRPSPAPSPQAQMSSAARSQEIADATRRAARSAHARQTPVAAHSTSRRTLIEERRMHDNKSSGKSTSGSVDMSATERVSMYLAAATAPEGVPPSAAYPSPVSSSFAQRHDSLASQVGLLPDRSAATA
jgi:hypothetical protein